MHFFYSKQIVGNEAILSTEETQHILKILRYREGDTVQISDGEGNLYQGTIHGTQKSGALVSGLERIEINDTPVRLHIFIALPKNHERFEWFLEKATEIGVGAITPLICHRSEKFFSKHERWNKILISAMKQSGRLYLPMLCQPRKFDEVLQLEFDKKLIAHCINTLPRKHLTFYLEKNLSTCILIGPEGDFTLEEVNKAESKGFLSVSLGNSRLRTETSGVVACSLLNKIEF